MSEVIQVFIGILIISIPVLILYAYSKGYEDGADDVKKGVQNVLNSTNNMPYLAVYNQPVCRKAPGRPKSAKSNNNGRK